MKSFNNAAKIDSCSPLPIINLALMQLQFMGDKDAGEALLRKAIDVDPNCEIAYSHLGQLLLGSNRTSDAIVVYQKAVNLFDFNV